MSVPHPIPYQGSKRGIAKQILRFFPGQFERLVEPFAGSAAVSLAAAHCAKASKFLLNDSNQALMNLWMKIIWKPEALADSYEALWNQQIGQERIFYNEVRAEFNRTQRAELLLYLMARCVKASIRYNANGEFNQSPDNRRRGRTPTLMRQDILRASALLCESASLTNQDYGLLLSTVSDSDLIYMDPPYQGVSGGRDMRYIDGVRIEELIHTLDSLNRREVPFILSYDGRNGERRYGQELPNFLKLEKIEIAAGRSSQSTLLGRADNTIESIYLSEALCARISSIGIIGQDAGDEQTIQPVLFA